MRNTVVVGGGIVGMSIAWNLAKRGQTVTVYDSGVIGGESSWAGAGMLAPGGETESVSPFARSLVESNALYPEFVRQLSAESGIPIDYRRCGAWEFTDTDEDWQHLLKRAQMQRALGIRSEVVRPGQIWYPDDAVVDPRDVVRALRVLCQRMGVVLREGHPVHSVRAASGAISHPEPAGAAVLAAGAWSSGIEVLVEGKPQPLVPAVPVRGHLVSWQLDPEAAGPVLRNGPTYIVQRSNGLTIGGSTHEHAGFDRTVDPAIVADVERRAIRLLPRLAGVPRASAWLGFRPFTADGAAQTGRLGDSPVYLAYGHYRNGILLAPWIGEFIASLEMGSFSPAAHR